MKEAGQRMSIPLTIKVLAHFHYENIKAAARYCWYIAQVVRACTTVTQDHCVPWMKRAGLWRTFEDADLLSEGRQEAPRKPSAMGSLNLDFD